GIRFRSVEEKFDTGSEEDMELLSAKAEAAAVAEKILEYTGNNSTFVIRNEAGDGYRKVRYGDIAILLRSDGGWFEVYANVLLNAGIPVSVETKGGYFDTMECKWVLDVLACVDNPYQDISLAGVMTSYFGGFTYEELAQIRSGGKENYLYENLLEAADSNEKVRQLLGFFEELKEVMNQGNLYDLMWQIVHLSGYYDYAGMMPAGGKRQANLDALILKARSFENSQMKGLFNFLRYIKQIGKYSIDTGEVGNSFDENAVRITTIHKSKGLEYPIVFVGKTMQDFNFQDTKKTVLIDSELGIGTYNYNMELRTRKNTFYRDVISKNMIFQAVAEEIRVLYVALTRAKEKLILVGASETLEKKLDEAESFANQMEEFNGSYMYADLMDCRNFYKMYMPVALSDKVHFSISVKKFDDLKAFVTDGERDVEDYDEDAQERTAVEPYPYEKYTSVRSKFSVSEIKHMSHAGDEDDYEKPSQLLGAAKGFLNLQGAARGTAYHRVMECLDYGDFNQETDNQAALEEKVAAQIASMVSRNLIPAADADTVDDADIAKFVASDLGKRVARAAALGLVKREQPFVYGVRAGDLICYRDIRECDELVLIQGEIDLYFFEGDKIILVDYKTDRVNPDNGREHLENMYREQLNLYGNALQQIIGSKYKVEEKIIYSFTLGEYFQV
ncbi:MAG: 3'-5' exonuclease, partial [Lachnospiraceae bacterium]